MGPLGSSSPLVVTLLLATYLYGGTNGECQGLQQCLEPYVAAGVKPEATPNFCSLAARTSTCMKPLSTSCKGFIPYQSRRRMLDNFIKRFNCSYILSHVSAPLKPPEATPKPKETCQYEGEAPAAHCGLFGDPHLKTFRNGFMTCGVGGAWPLLDTPYLAIQVTNEQVAPGTHATATTKVTVLVKEHKGCGAEKTYEASVEALPRAFVDGTTWTGGNPTRPHTQVQERIPGQHVLISVSHINATVAVRKIGKYLTVLVVLPESEVGAGGELQLCVGGCPEGERLAKVSSPPVVFPAMAKTQAVKLCKEYNVTDYYLDSCIFDLMATGDDSFRLAARAAQKDLWEHDPAGAQRLLLNCSEPPCVWDVSRGVSTSSCGFLVACLVVVVVSGARRCLER